MTVASIVAGKVAALRASGTEEVRTVKPDVTVAEAIRRMRDELVGALVDQPAFADRRGLISTLAPHSCDQGERMWPSSSPARFIGLI
jgi:hypothetical protein